MGLGTFPGKSSGAALFPPVVLLGIGCGLTHRGLLVVGRVFWLRFAPCSGGEDMGNVFLPVLEAGAGDVLAPWGFVSLSGDVS